MVSKKYATTPAIALFVIVSVTGLFLFFHLGGISAKVIHEWLGIGFIVAGSLHVIANWKPFLKYFSGIKGIAIGLLILIPTAFMLFSPTSGSSPTNAVVEKVLKSPLTKVASFYEKNPQEIIKALESQGYKISSLESSLLNIARENGKSPIQTLGIITTK